MNTGLTRLEHTTEIQTYSWSESMFTTMKLPGENMFQGRFSLTSNLVQWTLYVRGLSDRFFAQTISCLARVVPVTIGPKATIQKAPNLLIQFWMSCARRLKVAIVFRYSFFLLNLSLVTL